MSFLDYFPSKFDSPTSNQIDMLKKIEDIVNTGVSNIILCAPTGSGKSAIAMTFARKLGTSCIITTQKILQNQYQDNFPWGYSLKGKNNFLCLDLWDPSKSNYDDANLEPDLRCNKGVCTKTETHKNIIKYVDCEYKPNISDFKVLNQGTESETIQCPDDICYYYKQKFSSLLASHTIFNYSSFFQTLNFNQNIDHLLQKDCLIADEAHEIEDKIVSFLELNISRTYFKDSKVDITKYSLDNIDDSLTFINELIKEYLEIIDNLQNENTDLKNIYQLQKKIEHLQFISKQIKLNSENFIVENNYSNGKLENLTIKPLNIQRYARKYFSYPTQLFMSATVNKEMFCETMGFEESECEFIEIEKSSFLPENRAIKFLSYAKLSGSGAVQDLSGSFREIEKILQSHKNEKGLILTTSIKQCSQIINSISDNIISIDSWKRLRPVHSNTEDDKEETLRKHGLAAKSQVLLSPSLWYGIDLKDDLSRFQIILKTPYPYFGDSRTKAKALQNRTWYEYSALVKLLQGFGRSIRNKDDSAITYVLDSTALELIKKMKEYIPKAYYDILPLEE